MFHPFEGVTAERGCLGVNPPEVSRGSAGVWISHPGGGVEKPVGRKKGDGISVLLGD